MNPFGEITLSEPCYLQFSGKYSQKVLFPRKRRTISAIFGKKEINPGISPKNVN